MIQFGRKKCRASLGPPVLLSIKYKKKTCSGFGKEGANLLRKPSGKPWPHLLI